MRKAKTRPLTSDHQWAVTGRPPEDIARTLRLDKGLGFLVRLLDTRFKILYEQLTTQSEITPRQFGVLLTLYQCGTLTLTELAGHIRVDRSTLGEMISRMEERSLITKRINENDRRSAEVSLAPFGKTCAIGAGFWCISIANRPTRAACNRRPTAFHEVHEVYRRTWN